MKSPTIPEVEPQFEKEIDPFQQPFQQPFQAQVIRSETLTLSARQRSSIFEETLTPDPSMCRWLLDIISEDERMVKKSAHFVFSENQLIQVVDYTFDDRENKTQLIDAYSKTEADAILDDKLNISDQIEAYSKTEDDALLQLNAAKTELIDAY
ncbi:MAG: hypothetical protein EZS28_029743, partial [Streblomastix strix]